MTRPGMWSHYDDGIVSGRLLYRLLPCDVCGQATACVKVHGYDFPQGVSWRATIVSCPALGFAVAVFLGLGCGCLAKFHRQVAHIKDSIEEGNLKPT